MALDIELPLWTIKPNWLDGILERLSWLTDVMPSTWGSEQRTALRLSPRREFEMTFNPTGPARSYFELFLHRLGSQEFMLPMFHDRAKATAEIASGATSLPVDTDMREFTVGGLALILGDDPFTYDKVSITAIAPNALTVEAGGVTQTWPKGSSIYPLKRTRIEQESAAQALTSVVGQATVRFELNQANDIPDEGAWSATYGDHPILLDKPNRREAIDLSFLRNSLKVDNDHGLRHLGDDAGRAFTVQTYSKMTRGLAERQAFRQMLYRLRGQQGAVWLPSFNHDIVLARPAAAAETSLDVKKIGYAYTGGAVSGRKHVLLGSTVREISGASQPFAGEERLALTAAVGSDFLAGTPGSFVETCRLAQDDIEITHHTDTISECNLTFRAFRDERVPPPVPMPVHAIPASAQSLDQCGAPAPEEADCVNLESGFWGEFIFEFNHGANIPTQGAGMNIHLRRDGNYVAYLSNYGNDGTWSYDENSGQLLGQSVRMEYPNNNWPTDPFDQPGAYTIELDPIQYQFGAFGCGGGPASGCGGYGKAFFRRPNGALIPLTVTVGATHPTDPTLFEIERLWPRYYTLAWTL